MRKFLLGLVVGIVLVLPRLYLVESRLSEVEEERDDTCQVAHNIAVNYWNVCQKYNHLKASIETYTTHK